MTYGTIKVDTVTFTNDGVDKSITLSGLVQNPVFSGNVTVTGTLSGVTVTGTTANFTSGNFTNISGGTHTITSGVFAAGSAASPSITFTGDLNTGIYSPGADQVAISTGGSGRLFVDASGRVGIGTSSPGALFSLAGSSAYTVGNSGLATQGLDVNASAGGSGLFGGALSFGVGGTGRASISAFQGTADNDVVGLVFNVHTSGTAAADAVEAMRIEGSSGRVGIGTQSPGQQLTVETASGNCYIEAKRASQSTGQVAIALRGGTSGADCILYQNTNSNDLRFYVNGSDRAAIDSSGRLLVGTSSALTVSGAQHLLQIESTSSTTPHGASFLRHTGTAAGAGAVITLGRSRGTSAGAVTAVADGDTLGYIIFSGSNGTDFSNTAAWIQCQVDGVPFSSGDTTDLPGRLVFSTTADGASSPTERMRITNDGRVGIKETSFLGNAALAIGSSGSTNNDVYLRNDGTQTLSIGFVQSSLTSKSIACTTNDRINIFSNSDTSTGVYLTAGGTSWTSTSDERVKENLNPIQDGLSKVSSLRAVTGNYINDPLKKTVPFLLAQDVEQVLPEAVDSTDPDELGLSYTALIPLLVAALKESKERIETLEAKVAALESA